MIPHHRILLVDDEINVCRGCQRVFEREGYETEYALSGREGLDKALREAFDVIIADLKMPDISGIDVIKQIKQEKPDIPIIMITGYASVPSAVEAIKSGAVDYLPKPLKPAEILDVVEKALHKSETDTDTDISHERKVDVIIEKEQVQEILNRASRDNDFWIALLDKGSQALAEYRLSERAKAAIVSGDIRWIEKNIGKLTDEQFKLLERRLQQEKW